MKESKPRIVVNGVGITQAQIDAEVQYHPSPDFFTAQEEAARALVVRELLLQRAAKAGLCEKGGQAPEEIIERLLEKEVQTPSPDEETCRRYYQANKKKFMTMPLFEVSHILFLAPADDEKARKEARDKAVDILSQLREKPDNFEKLATAHSACPSGKTGGHLGQIGRGQTLPAFDAALQGMAEGEISREPVATEVGFHIIRMHRRSEGGELPFEAAHDWIVKHLEKQSWQRAVRQYISLLAGEADIVGYKMPSATTPLVQ